MQKLPENRRLIMTEESLVATSHAKLNVFLEVLQRRPDGFHELESVMLRTQFCDRLTFCATDDGRIELSLSPDSTAGNDASFPLNSRNLIFRVASALQARTGCRQGCRVVIEKHIPSEAGLGGGSANAATTLRVLNELWRLNLTESALHAIAADHGSDINFLLSGERAALCRGRGEEIHPLRLERSLHFVATRPASGNPTGVIFRNTVIPTTPRSSEHAIAWLRNAENPVEAALFNRLTAAARSCNPDMASLMDHLQRSVRRTAFMSGSGSTIFFIADDAADAAELAAHVQEQTDRPVWVLSC
jgi:4-diphosphocytidyl-2-C-methyl-D-erythritol kinase